ncbi:sensor domain-containing diguanylate cyclase [Neptunicella marina]|uniref:diguanylate cyclase n=1 Tax=Neptunicella marina TaxID=2125989 RepID=A0A8J6M3G3_9ALTE|nr:diguanylate cyclase [Neptunicella marina]MBC3765366.1 diguanylate cyclase [Neptunicella marina]
MSNGAVAEQTTQCQISQSEGTSNTEALVMDQTLILSMHDGMQRLHLDCHTDKQGVLAWSSKAVRASHLQINEQDVALMRSSEVSYLTPAGHFRAELDLTMENAGQLDFHWTPINQYVGSLQRNTLFVSLFVGLCLTLAVYVRIIGWHLSEAYFRLYSLYVVSATCFFIVQEGYLNLFFSLGGWQNSMQLYLALAGMTVFWATRFVISLLDLQALWPRYVRFGLLWPVWIVLGLSLLPLLGIEANGPNQVMSWLTLYISVGNFVLITLALLRKLHTAKLVFIAKCAMLVAMVIRITFPYSELFLRQYALLISMAFEAFLLAWATSEKIKQLNLQRQLAQREAITDPLCNVLNRRGWTLAAEQLIKQQQQQGGVLLVFYIDLNDFKHINDQYGHQIGDEVLQRVADILKHQVRDSEAVGRLGGDEFVVMGHFSEQLQGRLLYERLQQRMGNILIRTSAGELSVSASAGMQLYQESPHSVEQVLQESDQMMYEHKRAIKQST